VSGDAVYLCDEDRIKTGDKQDLKPGSQAIERQTDRRIFRPVALRSWQCLKACDAREAESASSKFKLTAHWESLPFQFLINKLHGDHDCGDQDDNQPKDKFHFHRRSQASAAGMSRLLGGGQSKASRLCAKKFGICCPFETNVCGRQCTRPNASKMTSRCCNKGRKILVCGKTLALVGDE
jgi:hypothetical protein